MREINYKKKISRMQEILGIPNRDNWLVLAKQQQTEIRLSHLFHTSFIYPFLPVVNPVLSAMCDWLEQIASNYLNTMLIKLLTYTEAQAWKAQQRCHMFMKSSQIVSILLTCTLLSKELLRVLEKD